eukprot:g83268.t1
MSLCWFRGYVVLVPRLCCCVGSEALLCGFRGYVDVGSEAMLLCWFRGHVKTFTPKCASKQLKLVTNNAIKNNKRHDFIGDKHRIRQILSNYVSNAIKFSENADIIIRVRQHFVEGDEYGYVSEQVQQELKNGSRMWIRFSVQDKGIGLTPEQQANLFQPYSQFDPGVNQDGGGTGLGLSICKQLASLQQGFLGVKSSKGKGSEFFVVLPLRSSHSFNQTPGKFPEFRNFPGKLTTTVYAILYYTILYYTILYYTILHKTILYYTILYYTILYYTVLYYTILYYTIIYCTILYYTILYYTILYYTILYDTILYYTTLHYTTLYYTILYYTILYYTILYYTTLYYTTLLYTTLHYTTLHYTTLYYTYTTLYYTILYCT